MLHTFLVMTAMLPLCMAAPWLPAEKLGPAQQETALRLLLLLLHLATHRTAMQRSSVTVAAGARSAHEVEASKRRIARWGTDQEEGQAFCVCCCVASVGYVLKVRIQYKLHALGRWASSPVGG